MADHDTELRRGFEQTATNNIKAGIAHGNETRKIVKALDEKVFRLENIIKQQHELLGQFRQQLAGVQQRLYVHGSEPLVTAPQVEDMIKAALEKEKDE